MVKICPVNQGNMPTIKPKGRDGGQRQDAVLNKQDILKLEGELSQRIIDSGIVGAKLPEGPFKNEEEYLTVLKTLEKTLPTAINVLRASRINNINIRNQDEYTRLHLAAYHGHTELVTALITVGAEVNSRTNPAAWTSLHMAAQEGHTDTVHILLNAGADVDLVDYFGRTSLHEAAQEGHTATVHILLNAGAGVDLLDKSKKTPCQLAARYGKTEVVKILKAANDIFNLCKASKHSNNTIHQTPKSRRQCIDRLFISSGLRSVNFTINGKTSIHRAIKYNLKDVVELLLHKGADPNRASANGKTPCQLAARYGKQDILNVLMARVAGGYGS